MLTIWILFLTPLSFLALIVTNQLANIMNDLVNAMFLNIFYFFFKTLTEQYYQGSRNIVVGCLRAYRELWLSKHRE
jgi:hypothetical protein